MLLAGLAAVWAAAAGDAPSNLPKEVVEVRTKCLTPKEEEELKGFENKPALDKDLEKAKMLCIFRGHKVIGEDNKYSKLNLMRLAHQFLDGKPDGEAKLKSAQEIADLCEKSAEPAPAALWDLANNIFICLKKNKFDTLVKPYN